MTAEIRSSFHGRVQWLPDISVDNFEDRTKEAYFLSHAHTDHMVGLSDLSKQFRSDAKIYMTHVTKTILRIKYGNAFHSYASKVIVLDSGLQNYNIMVNGEIVQISLIPAVHMPGAVMFLFKTSKGKVILYTGDFVMNDAQLNEFKQSDWLRGEDGQRIGVDMLYFDATFRHMNRFRHAVNKNVPDRSYCIQAAANEIREWLDRDASNAFALSTYYDFGYEDLFKGIYDQLGGTERIMLTNIVQRTVYRQILGEYENVYTDDSSSRIHVCASRNHCTVGCSQAHYKKLIVFAFPGDEPIQENDYNIPNARLLCFPTHSSDSQLTNFIDYIRPTLDPVPFPILIHH